MSLPRYRLANNSAHDKNEKGKIRSFPGEEETALYPIFGTSEHDLDSWGIGVVVYFNVLKKMCIIFFIIGLLNIPNIWYFRENLNTEMELDIFTFITFGTAICDDFEWVECENCADKPEFKNDLGASVIGNDNITRYRRYNCEAVSLLTGSISLATLFTLLLGFLYLVSSVTKREGTADTSKISSSDYSIMVMNPPPDAFDPDDWRDFFSTFDEHKPPLVTVALNNHTLIEATVQLRIVRKKLQSMLPSVDLKDKEALARAVKKSREKRKTTKIQMFLRFLLRPFGLWLYEEDLLSKYDNLMEKVKHLQSLNYKVMRVFVTMETEQGQRAALEALDVMAMNKVEKFQNTVLRVKEAREPTAIRWNDLHYNRKWKLLFRTTTLLLTFAIIGLQGYAVWAVTKKFEQVVWAAFTVKLGNIIFPQLLILFTNYEGHWSEGSRQLSIYFKITLFRWINTVFIILLLAPRTRILSGEIVESIGPILLFEIFFSPIIKYLDIVGNIKKHILAPRAHDQARMNSYFRGTVYNLAERYTVSANPVEFPNVLIAFTYSLLLFLFNQDMTKMVVLCMTFSAIYPSIFLIGFIALLVQLISDKYCLLVRLMYFFMFKFIIRYDLTPCVSFPQIMQRIWSHSSDIGPQVSRFSRVYVLPSAIVIFVVSTTYFSQGFPFDHLCSTEVDGIYQYCDQSYSIFNPYPPKLLKNAFGWMTEMQITVATVSSWVTFLILILFGLLILYDRFGSWSKYFLKNRKVSFMRGLLFNWL